MGNEQTFLLLFYIGKHSEKEGGLEIVAVDHKMLGIDRMKLKEMGNALMFSGEAFSVRKVGCTVASVQSKIAAELLFCCLAHPCSVSMNSKRI